MYQWTKVTERAPFAPRDGAGALVFNNRMWMLGGWNPDDKVNFPKICNSEVWSSSDGADWRLENPHAPWEGRHAFGRVIHRGRMWIVGGDVNQGYYQSDVWNSADGIRWERVCEKVPWAPRWLTYTFAFDGKIWVMGGQTLPQFAPADEMFYNDVWNSADGVNWTRVADHRPWGPRGDCGGCVEFQNRIWMLGGGTYDTPGKPDRIVHNDIWTSSDGVRWDPHTQAAPWTPRQMHDVAVFDRRLWVMEGYNDKEGGNRKDVWWSADGIKWTELADTPWAPRHAAAVFVHANALWMVGGNNMTSDVWKLQRVAR